MKTTKIHRAWLLAGLCFIVSCQQESILEEPTDQLPYRLFPVEFTPMESMDPSPISRVKESSDGIRCFWSEGDQIGIALQGGGNDATAIGTLTAEGEMMQTTLFWKTKQPSKVSAWYPAAEGTVSLKEQNRQLVYLLKAETEECNYLSGPVNLKFRHQLAKIRIILKDRFSWLRYSELSILGYTSCDVNEGEFVFNQQKDYIKMRDTYYRYHIYEANIAPMHIAKGEDILKISNWMFDKFYTVSQDIDFEAGYLYSFTIKGNLFH